MGLCALLYIFYRIKESDIDMSTTVSCTTRMDEWEKHAKGFVKHSDFSEIF